MSPTDAVAEAFVRDVKMVAKLAAVLLVGVIAIAAVLWVRSMPSAETLALGIHAAGQGPRRDHVRPVRRAAEGAASSTR